MKNYRLALATLFFAALANASTVSYFGGFEDTNAGGDHDYQDVVFGLSSAFNTLTLNGNGQFFLTSPVVTGGNNGDGTPYWNNPSGDSGTPNPDIGSCLYQGCVTNRGTVNAVAFPNTLDYYASSNGSAPSSIYFTDTGADQLSIFANITADTDKIGYAVCNDATCNNGFGAVNYFSGNTNFSPCGGGTCSFVLVGDVNNSATPTFSVAGTGFQSFALFDDTCLECRATSPVPEPSSVVLLGGGLLLVGLGSLRFRRQQSV